MLDSFPQRLFPSVIQSLPDHSDWETPAEMALSFFSASVLLDTVLEHYAIARHVGVQTVVLEDSTKFLGIFCWCGFFVRRVVQTVPVMLVQDASQPADPILTRYATPDSPA